MKPKLWHHILTGLSGLSLLGVTIFTAVRWNSLPDRIPTHFNAAGLADGYGPKSGVVMLLGLAWFMLILLTVAAFFPNAWNVPNRSPRTLAAAANMVAVMKLMTSLLFAWVVFCTVQGRGLGAWFMPAIMTGMFAPLVYLLIACARK